MFLYTERSISLPAQHPQIFIFYQVVWLYSYHLTVSNISFRDLLDMYFYFRDL